MENKKSIMAMIIEDFECLKMDIDSLKDFYKVQAKEYIDGDKIDESQILLDKYKEIEKYKVKIEDLLDEFDSIITEEIEETQETSNENQDEGFVEMRNFSYTNPVQYILLKKNYNANRNWRDVLIKVCEEMIKKQPEKFSTFDKNEAFIGRTRAYFSYDSDKLTKNNRKLSNGLFVELNLSANDIVKRCRDILEQCGYNPDEIKFKVEVNDEIQNTNESTSIIEKTDSEIKLSRSYASIHVSKELFKSIVNDIINFEEIYQAQYVSPVKIKDRLKEKIISDSIYSSPYHVVINIFKYLLDCKLIENMPNTKKGKYLLKNKIVLQSWLEKNL